MDSAPPQVGGVGKRNASQRAVAQCGRVVNAALESPVREADVDRPPRLLDAPLQTSTRQPECSTVRNLMASLVLLAVTITPAAGATSAEAVASHAQRVADTVLPHVPRTGPDLRVAVVERPAIVASG